MTSATSGVDSRRLARAALVVALLLATVPLIDAIAGSGRAAAAGSELTGLNLGSICLTGVVDPDEALERIEELAEAECVPSGGALDEDLVFLEGARDVRVGHAGTVVGYVVAGDAEEVVDRLSRRMQEKGWRSVSLGGVTGETYVKQEGRLTWALATCTQVADATSVVIRCRADGQ